jgi:hypothetical protein
MTWRLLEYHRPKIREHLADVYGDARAECEVAANNRLAPASRASQDGPIHGKDRLGRRINLLLLRLKSRIQRPSDRQREVAAPSDDSLQPTEQRRSPRPRYRIQAEAAAPSSGGRSAELDEERTCA